MLIDEIPNSVLFLLIGLEVQVISFNLLSIGLAASAIPIVLFARSIAELVPGLLFARTGSISLRNLSSLAWAGVCGGISVALALAMPAGEARSAILAATYATVPFSIIVQCLTLPAVARRTIGLRKAGSYVVS